MTFAPATCPGKGHAVYWSNLALVKTHTWAGSQCVTGASPIDFAPSPSNVIFVVVGNHGTQQGSYGKESSGAQIPEAVGIGGCDHPQQLTGSCDP